MLKWPADVFYRVESDLQGHCHPCKTQHLICSNFPTTRGQVTSVTPEPGVLRLTLGSHLSCFNVLMGWFFGFGFSPPPHVLHSLPIQGQNLRDCLVCTSAAFAFFLVLITALSALEKERGIMPSRKTVVLDPSGLPCSPLFFSANPRGRVELIIPLL